MDYLIFNVYLEIATITSFSKNEANPTQIHPLLTING